MSFADQLVALTKHGQLGLELLRPFLTPACHGLTFDAHGVVERWSPHENVVMDPAIQFGAPCLKNTRIATEALWAFAEAGDSPEAIARMYNLEIELVRHAIVWEQRLSLAK